MSQPWTHSAPGIGSYERVNEHYVEPYWVTERLFDVEKFEGAIYDPCCGFGRILDVAAQHKHYAYGSDISDRGGGAVKDFLKDDLLHINIVCNPPFDIVQTFTQHALKLAQKKVAIIFPTARLNAARWLQETPLRRVWLLTPRPSMPPGHVILSGGKVGGGKSDYCWLVFEKGFSTDPVIKWLHRDES